MIKNTLWNKLGKKLKKRLKKSHGTWKPFNWCTHSWLGFTDSVLPVVLFTDLWFKWSVKEHCAANILLTIWYFHMEIIVNIISPYLVSKMPLSLSCPWYFHMEIIVNIISPYLVSKMPLSLSCPFLKTKSKNHFSSKLVFW